MNKSELIDRLAEKQAISRKRAEAVVNLIFDTYVATKSYRKTAVALNKKGYRIDTLLACGGGTKNPVFLREHADITGCRIVLPREPEAVLLGAAVLGSVAAGHHDSVLAAMGAMSR